MGKILTDTVIITLAAVMLYGWGMLYYSALSECLGFQVGVCYIPLYDIIFAPWDSAILAILIGLVICIVWYARGLIGLLVFYILLAFALFTKKVLGWLCRVRAIRAFFESAKGKLLSGWKWLKEYTPKSLLDETGDVNADRIIVINACALILGVFIVVAGIKVKGAQDWVSNYNANKGKHGTVEVLCQDGSSVKGSYVRNIGNCVIIDLSTPTEQKRVLVKDREIKKISFAKPISTEQKPANTDKK